jgi:sugar phosphate isomerase/epimerase
MKIEQVALQLFTLRNHLKTPEDILATLKKVAAIGYQAVQVSGMAPIDEKELTQILAGEGLTLAATHEPPDVIRQNPEKVVERLRKLNTRYTAYPYPSNVDWSKQDDTDRLIADLDRAGAVLHAAGQVLTYHNHAIEFIRIGNATALDYIYAKSDPRYLQGEIDTYWVQFGGGDPVAWCRKLKGRLPLLHLKDYAFTLPDQPTYAAIGSGNLDWPAIISAAEASGTEWFIVEQDTTPGDPFEAVKQSFDYIKANLVS